MHTGDLGSYNENGEVVISGRIKLIMKYRYHQVSPFEIENIILQHPDVLEAVVVPIPHEIDTERPMAFVRKNPGSKVNINLKNSDSCRIQVKVIQYSNIFITLYNR